MLEQPEEEQELKATESIVLMGSLGVLCVVALAAFGVGYMWKGADSMNKKGKKTTTTLFIDSNKSNDDAFI
jgi:hypothetical protein